MQKEETEREQNQRPAFTKQILMLITELSLPGPGIRILSYDFIFSYLFIFKLTGYVDSLMLLISTQAIAVVLTRLAHLAQ